MKTDLCTLKHADPQASKEVTWREVASHRPDGEASALCSRHTHTHTHTHTRQCSRDFTKSRGQRTGEGREERRGEEEKSGSQRNFSHFHTNVVFLLEYDC